MLQKLFENSPKLTIFFLLGALCCCVSTVLANREIISPIIGLGGIMLGVLCLAAVAFTVVFCKMRGVHVPNWYIFIFGLLPLLGVFSIMLQSMGTPLINDITTSIASPPAIELNEFGKYPQEFHEPMKKSYNHILEMSQTIDRLQFDKIEKVLHSEGFAKIKEGRFLYFKKVYKSAFLRFPDHFVIRFDSDGGKSHMDLRSKSVYGRSDFGVNAQRISQWFNRLVKL